MLTALFGLIQVLARTSDTPVLIAQIGIDQMQMVFGVGAVIAAVFLLAVACERPAGSPGSPKHEEWALLLGLVLMLVLGVAVLADYGASVDEEKNAYYGRLFLDAYRAGSLLRWPGIEYFNGPFYFMVFTVTSRLFQSLNPRWLLTDGLHLTNFITFLVGVFIFYRLSLRLLSRRVGLFVTALFATQPVLFGHAFINQKDTPLMVFFLASVELGWTAVEARLAAEPRRIRGGEGRGVVGEWRLLSRVTRTWIAVGGLLGLVVLADLWWGGGMQRAAKELLPDIYAGRGPRVLVELFGLVAQDAYKTPLSAYVVKLDALFSTARLAAVPLLAGAVLVVWRLTLPEHFANTVALWFRRWGVLLLAGCVLGMTTSIRALGPFAGVLVGAYWIHRGGRRSVPGLLAYGAAAGVTTYLTWPVLWGNPLVGLAQRVSEMPRFELHEVLFQGSLYASGSLPWQYLPTLLAVQLTLPCLLLFLIGIPYSWVLSRADRDRRMVLILSWLWFLLPAVAVMLRWISIYNSFRHVLFALPPAFLVMGFGAQALSDALRRPALRVGLATLALVPGMVGIVRLHPYEYIYYNELVGGVRGAEGRFDLDYWCTAFRETVTEVNAVARSGARVETVHGIASATAFVREDLELVQRPTDGEEPDFAMACRRDVYDASFFPDLRTIYEVRAEGALLAVVKQRTAGP